VMTRIAVVFLAALVALAPLGAGAAELWMSYQGLHVTKVAKGCKVEMESGGSTVVTCNESALPAKADYTTAVPTTGASDVSCVVEVTKRSTGGYNVSVMWGGKVRCASAWKNGGKTVDITYTRT
jgi:hypothetical protein